MIGSKFTHDGIEYEVTRKADGRSWWCLPTDGGTNEFSIGTRTIYKYLPRPAKPVRVPAQQTVESDTPPIEMTEDLALDITINTLEQIDVTAQARVVRRLAVDYLDTQPLEAPAA